MHENNEAENNIALFTMPNLPPRFACILEYRPFSVYTLLNS